MSDEIVSQAPTVFSSKERAALVARALSEAARRARFSTKRRRNLATGGVRQRRGARLLHLLRIWTFIGIVVVPTLVFVGYLFLIATPQYTAEARFTLRGGMPAAMTSMGSLSNAPTMLIVQDTQVVLHFMTSRAMVEDLNKAVGYERLFQDPSVDWLSRLKPHQAIENVVKYWARHMSTTIQMPSGIVTLAVRAFSPDDAVKVANAAITSSEQLVNDMNDKMLADAVALADAERVRAQANLATTRANLERARNEEGMLSAKEAAKAVDTLIEKVEVEQLKMQQEYDSQRHYVRADSPQLRNLQTKIDASKKEIETLKAQVTRTGPAKADDRPVISGAMSRLDYATLENSIAEKIYALSLAAVEQTHLASESKLMYLNTFVKPVAAEQSEYPKRGLDTTLFILAALGVWFAVIAAMGLAKNLLRNVLA